MLSLRAATALGSQILRSYGLGSAAIASTRIQTAACYHTSVSAARDQDALGRDSSSRVPGAFDDARQGTGDTYYATAKYPSSNNTEDASSDAQSAAAAASSAPHPKGAADTSSMNASEGKGKETLSSEQSQRVHHPGRPDFDQGSKRSVSSLMFARRCYTTSIAAAAQDSDKPDVIHGKSQSETDGMFSGMQSMSEGMPQGMSERGTRDAQAMAPGSAEGVGQGTPQRVEGMAQGSYAGAGAGADHTRSTGDRWSEPNPQHSMQSGGDSEVRVPESTLQDGTPTEAAQFEHVEGGKSGGIAGAWRAMTADFAAGGDDMTGGGTAGTAEDDAAMNASVNPDSGLPSMSGDDDSKAHAAGFGQKRDPSASKEQGMTARQTERSSGQVPADVGSS